MGKSWTVIAPKEGGKGFCRTVPMTGRRGGGGLVVEGRALLIPGSLKFLLVILDKAQGCIFFSSSTDKIVNSHSLDRSGKAMRWSPGEP